MNKFIVSSPATDSGTGLINDLDVLNEADKEVTCSFAGGCLRSIEQKGLKTSIMNGLAEVKVCGKTCEIDENESDYE